MAPTKVVYFEKQITGTEARTTKICPGFEFMRECFCTLETIEEWRLDKHRFSEDVTGSKVTNPESALVSSPGKDAEFRDIFSYDIQ
jgi:hypothetical protein